MSGVSVKILDTESWGRVSYDESLMEMREGTMPLPGEEPSRQIEEPEWNS